MFLTADRILHSAILENDKSLAVYTNIVLRLKVSFLSVISVK